MLTVDIAAELRLHRLSSADCRHLQERCAQAIAHFEHGLPLVLDIRLDTARVTAILECPLPVDARGEHADDTERVEKGAEAVALAVIGKLGNWRVVRRLQRYEFADWLFAAPSGEKIAVEISGTGNSSYLAARLAAKIEQIMKCRVPAKVVFLVAFDRLIALSHRVS